MGSPWQGQIGRPTGLSLRGRLRWRPESATGGETAVERALSIAFRGLLGCQPAITMPAFMPKTETTRGPRSRLNSWWTCVAPRIPHDSCIAAAAAIACGHVFRWLAYWCSCVSSKLAKAAVPVIFARGRLLLRFLHRFCTVDGCHDRVTSHPWQLWTCHVFAAVTSIRWYDGRKSRHCDARKGSVRYRRWNTRLCLSVYAFQFDGGILAVL